MNGPIEDANDHSLDVNQSFHDLVNESRSSIPQSLSPIVLLGDIKLIMR